MSKRRKKGNNKPNIPQATLDRAREQAGLPVEQPVEEEPQEVAAKPAISPKNKSAARAASTRRRASNRTVSAGQIDLRKRRGDLDVGTVEAALAHPTKFPTEEELHATYGFVLRDLRNMFILAAVLLVVLIIMATVL
jgi:hypothetical protein